VDLRSEEARKRRPGSRRDKATTILLDFDVSRL
jgi:hypothetical protein